MKAYPIAIGVVKGLELHNVWVTHNAHDLKLTVLDGISYSSYGRAYSRMYLETLVL